MSEKEVHFSTKNIDVSSKFDLSFCNVFFFFYQQEKSEEIESLNHKLGRLEEELEDTDKRDTDDRHMVKHTH